MQTIRHTHTSELTFEIVNTTRLDGLTSEIDSIILRASLLMSLDCVSFSQSVSLCSKSSCDCNTLNAMKYAWYD